MKKGWEIKKLGAVCDVLNGGTPDTKKKEFWDGNILWITPKDMGKLEMVYVDDTERKITEAGLKNSSAKILPVNSVVLSSRAPIGHLAINTKPISTNQGCKGLVPKNDLDTKYLYYFLRNSVQLLNDLGTGTTFKELSGSKLSEVEIPLYPLPEQRRIVSLLDKCCTTIDKAKANAEQNLINAKELFDCTLDRILDDKKWKVKQLGEVCEKVEYGTSSKAKSQGLLPVLRMGNIQNGKFIWDSLVYSDNKEDNSQYLLKYNDVLFNRTNSLELVGKTAIFKGERPAIFAGYLIRIHRKENLLDADYLNYYLNSKKAFEYGKSVVISSVNQANINGTKLKTYPIPLPPLHDQQSIVRQLDALRDETQKLEAVYQKKIANLEELKKSVLQKAFSGELRSKNGGNNDDT